MCVGLVWVMIMAQLLPPNYLPHLAIIKRNSILPTFFVIAFAACVSAGLLPYRYLAKIAMHKNTLIGILLICITTLELLRFSNKYTPFSPQEFFYPEHAVITQLQQLTQKNGSRYYDYVPINTNVAFHVAAVGGSDPLYNQHLGELAIQSKQQGAVPTDRGAMQFPDGPHKQQVLNLFAAQYYPDYENNFRNSWVEKHGGKHELFDATFSLEWEENLYQIYKNRYAMPRAYMVYNIIREDNKDNVLRGLTSSTFVASQSAYISYAGTSQQKTGTGAATIIKNSAQEIIITATSDQPGLLVLTDTYYPGWKAYVNKNETEILRTNWGFRGVYVPQGTSEVTFIYTPITVAYGAAVSVASLLLLFAYYLRRKK
ncbi:MAG: Bacterial membrane protein YfhO [Microgenomates bacterium OLB23]|nr:MAG: Bacterial membrane protein YfhO [Microgenomates bacterium OLB23]